MSRDLGLWLLPQPTKSTEYVKIPVLKKNAPVPFGYKLDENDPDWYVPIPFELDALKQAKEYVKRYSLKTVANWLTKQTGRHISHYGLQKRIAHERRWKNRGNFYAALASEYKEALQKAKQYEERLGKEVRNEFYNQERYRSIFDNDASSIDSDAGCHLQSESGAADKVSGSAGT